MTSFCSILFRLRITAVAKIAGLRMTLTRIRFRMDKFPGIHFWVVRSHRNMGRALSEELHRALRTAGQLTITVNRFRGYSLALRSAAGTKVAQGGCPWAAS